MWDATIVDTLAPSYINDTASSVGSAANRAEDIKKAKYRDVPVGYEFIPLAFETLGSMGDETKDFMFKLCANLRESTRDTRAGAYFLQRVSLCLIRGNASSMMGTLLGDDGYQMDDVILSGV